MIKFGTGGFRAVIGEDYTRANVELVGQALCEILQSDGLTEKPVVIGFDNRFLSPESARWLAEVFAANQIPVFLFEQACPTPMVMFAVQELRLNLGCMITASYNPADYNGIKLVLAGGRDADVEFTSRLEQVCLRLASQASADPAEFTQVKSGLIKFFDNSNEYLDHMLTLIDQPVIRAARLKILFDPMYGVAGRWVNSLLASLRCSVDIIHNYRDPLFGGQLPAPLPTTTQELQLQVPQNHYDFGIATDGDADRIGVVDIDGSYLDCNNILALVYYYLLKYRHLQGDVVRNLGTSTMVDRIAADFGYHAYEVPVGFKFITETMRKHDALLGGEASGGLTTRNYLQGKDSVFAAILLVEIVAKTGLSLGELMAEIHQKYGQLYQFEQEITFDKLGKGREQLTSILTVPVVSADNEDVREISYTDGQKVYFKDGWALVRLSGTEPLLRISCEANTPTKLSEYQELIKRGLRL